MSLRIQPCSVFTPEQCLLFLHVCRPYVFNDTAVFKKTHVVEGLKMKKNNKHNKNNDQNLDNKVYAAISKSYSKRGEKFQLPSSGHPELDFTYTIVQHSFFFFSFFYPPTSISIAGLLHPTLAFKWWDSLTFF